MRRVETYVGQQVYEWLFSSQAQLTMVGLSKLSAAMLGTSGTVNGLPCTPTSPATMTVQIGAGEIYQMADLEATACGTLPANTTNTILKQGIQLGTSTTTAFAAPTTSGQSINYLIEVQYQDSDISLDPTTGNSPIVELFYNSVNPQAPWSGPNDSGATSNTFRDGIVAYQIKAGASATTGSQVTPTPDAGWIGLWVVSVPFGATTLTSSNIAQYTGAPVLPNGLLQSILTSNLTYGIDIGTAGVVQAKFPIPVATLVDGMDVWVKIAATNTGASTFTPNPGVISASPVIGAAHAALQGNELIAGGRANLVWRADVTSWVLVECTGASIQVAPATASQHAVQLGQATGRLLNTIIYINVSGALQASVNGGAFASVSSTYNPLSSLCNAVEVETLGGGGGGGGAAPTSSGQCSAGSGGGGGGWSKGRFSTGFTGVTVTAGAGGNGSAGASGTAGGSSSFGALISATGGTGGTFGAAAANTTNSINGGVGGGVGSGGQINAAGGVGPGAFYAGTPVSGKGGMSMYGEGAPPVSGTSSGAAGNSLGSGGSGGSLGAGSATGAAGGAGKGGLVIVREYS